MDWSLFQLEGAQRVHASGLQMLESFLIKIIPNLRNLMPCQTNQSGGADHNSIIDRVEFVKKETSGRNIHNPGSGYFLLYFLQKIHWHEIMNSAAGYPMFSLSLLNRILKEFASEMLFHSKGKFSISLSHITKVRHYIIQ